MSRTKKKSKKTPQNQRKSSRSRKRSIKGQYYDEHVLETETSSSFSNQKACKDGSTPGQGEDNKGVSKGLQTKVDIIASNINGESCESFTQSTPSVICATTPRRKTGSPEAFDLQTLLTVSDVVETMVDNVDYEFPESVVAVDKTYVKRIDFEKEPGNAEVERRRPALDEEQISDKVYWQTLDNISDLCHYFPLSFLFLFPPSHRKTFPSCDERRLSQCEVAEQSCLKNSDLEKAIDEHINTINTLLHKQNIWETRTDALTKTLFEKEQQLKLMGDKIRQLQDSNSYRKEVVRLERVLEEGETELRIAKEDLNIKTSKIDQNLKSITELKEDLERKEEKVKKLEEENYGRSELEEYIKRKDQRIVELEEKLEGALKLEGVAEQKDVSIKELKENLVNALEKIKTLEANQTFLMNENAILKSEIRLAVEQKKRDDEELLKVPAVNKGSATKSKPGNDEYAKVRKELNTLKGEMKQFREYTFQRFDQLACRSSIAISTCQTTSEEDESVEEAESELPEPLQSKPVPPRRKLWDKNQVQVVPCSLRFDGNNPQTAENSPDEAGRTIPLVPGVKTYSGAVRSSSAPPKTASDDFNVNEKQRKIDGIKSRRRARERKTLIFSSSITRDIKKQSFNFDCKTSDVVFHEFRGKKAKDIVRYMVPHLEDEQPNTVVLVGGGNDLPDRDISISEIRKVANCLMEGGRCCRDQHGVESVFISSIMPRSNSKFQGNRHRLNIMLKELCISENGINFIDNDNIVLRPHGHPDGVHLNERGTDLLYANLLNVLDS